MKWARNAALVAWAMVLLSLGGGWAYQTAGSARDAAAYHPIGVLHEVAGHRMHLYLGGSGPATVVFASGWGTASPYADFSPLYEGLEPYVNVAVYDRFGYGYSDTTGLPRDVDRIADEIRALLDAGGAKPPYVFVGHSLGSLEAIRYAQRYPDEVKGLLMIDGGSPEYYAARDGLTAVPYAYRALRVTGALRALYLADGFEAWANDQNNGLRLLSYEMRELSRKATLLKTGNRDMTDEIRKSRSNAERILKDKKPLDVPMTVLTADSFGALREDPAWESSQAAFPSWSRAGKQIVVEDASHYIHGYRPDVVVREALALALAGAQ